MMMLRILGAMAYLLLTLSTMSAVADEVVASAAGGWYAVDSRAVKDTTWEGGAIVVGETNIVLQSSANAWGEAGGGVNATISWGSETGKSGMIAAATTADTVEWTPITDSVTNTLKYVSGSVVKTATFVVNGIIPVGVGSITARQRYPWNGMVDLTFTVTGAATDKYVCSFIARDVVGGTNLAMRTLQDDKGTIIPASNVIFPGTYHWTWNAAADLPDGFVCDCVTVTATATVEEHLGGVQLWENGPYWAECNVGATKPEEYGYYFWWGDTVGCKLNASKDGLVSVKDGSEFILEDCPTYYGDYSTLLSLGYIDSTGNLTAAHDAATSHLGSPWRMPTVDEFAALIDNCDATWATCNGVYGYLVNGRGAYSSKSIFLPAAGYVDNFYSINAGLVDAGWYGDYWSSTPCSYDSYHAWCLDFYSRKFTLSNFDYDNSYHRSYGQSVRPIRAFVKQSSVNPADATGAPIGIVGDVLVIDVSAGSTASSYPTIEWSDVDIGTFNCDVYKTDKIVLKKVPAGSYFCQPGADEKTVVSQKLTTKGFYIGVFPVTQRQYERVMGSNPSYSQTDASGNAAAQRPVEQVSWNTIRGSVAAGTAITASSADSFMKRLVAKTGLSGFDLPTEAQWEMACRAGSTAAYGSYCNGSVAVEMTVANIGDVAWYYDNSSSTTHAVGEKKPNLWGLYDTQGNVWEWCRDIYISTYSTGYVDVPCTETSDVSGVNRVERGGVWYFGAEYCRPSDRGGNGANGGYRGIGFRLSRALP